MSDRHLAAVEAYLRAEVERGRTPGLQYVAVGPEGPTLSLAIGWADIGRRVAMTPATTLMAYSMTKTVTAIAVLQLAEEGQLALDAPAIHYLGDCPYDASITIRELLAHTGGVPNPIPLRWVHAEGAHAAFDERAALTAVLRAHPRARHAGMRYGYSNIGYWLLGAIVERVTGMRFADRVATRIFAPLGLSAQEIGFTVADGVSHATGYLERWSLANLFGRWLIDRDLLGDYETAGATWRRIGAHYPNGPAFGGIVARATAFARLLQDQLQPASVILGERGRRWLYEWQHTRRGGSVPMTLGWHVESRDSRAIYFKEGGGGGFHCLMRLCPARGWGDVLMANATAFPVRATPLPGQYLADCPELPREQLHTSARVRLSTGDELASRENTRVPARGSVPGGTR